MATTTTAAAAAAAAAAALVVVVVVVVVVTFSPAACGRRSATKSGTRSRTAPCTGLLDVSGCEADLAADLAAAGKGAHAALGAVAESSPDHVLDYADV